MREHPRWTACGASWTVRQGARWAFPLPWQAATDAHLEQSGLDALYRVHALLHLLRGSKQGAAGRELLAAAAAAPGWRVRGGGAAALAIWGPAALRSGYDRG